MGGLEYNERVVITNLCITDYVPIVYIFIGDLFTVSNYRYVRYTNT